MNLWSLSFLFSLATAHYHHSYLPSCKHYLEADANAPSGEYIITAGQSYIDVYCEMGLNGGGYTFIDPIHLPGLTNDYLQSLFTDRTTFLMRARTDSGLQSYGVLSQLNQYSSTPLLLSLDSNPNYNGPANANALDGRYIYYGFLPISIARARSTQGLKVNGWELTFQNCDANPNSYIALFPNFKEKTPINYAYGTAFPLTERVFGSLRSNPSGRVMPEKYFMFMETQWGGCGSYTQTDGRGSIRGIVGAAIGFR